MGKINNSTADILARILDGDDCTGLTRRHMYRLKARGLVEHTGGGSAKLTDLGRWQTIAHKMHLHPVELFILSDMYVERHLRESHNMERFPYSFESMEERLTEILDIPTVQNRRWKLKRCGAIERVDMMLYNITDRWVKRLNRYHDDVCAMRDYVRARMLVP